MAESLPDEYQLLADLPQSQPYVFPPHIATTDQRPDIVVWSNTAQEVWVIELTVCFETGMKKHASGRPTDTHRPHETDCSLLYKKQQVSQACQLLASTDPVVRFTTTVEIRREEALQ